MARRFNDLEERVITLLKDGKDPLNSEDDEIRNYWRWKLRKDKTKRQRDEASIRKTGTRDYVVILPFATTGTDAYTYAGISDRAYSASPDGLTKSNFHWVTTVPSGKTVDFRQGFKPAQAVIRQKASGSPAKVESKITGELYRPRSTPANAGYVYPFGRPSGGGTLIAAQQTILADVKENFTVAFKPEIYKSLDNVKATFAA